MFILLPLIDPPIFLSTLSAILKTTCTIQPTSKTIVWSWDKILNKRYSCCLRIWIGLLQTITDLTNLCHIILKFA